jgi:hypothetical protein
MPEGAAAYTAGVVKDDGVVEKLEQLVVIVGERGGKTTVHWRLPKAKHPGARGLVVALAERPDTVAVKDGEAFARIEMSTAPRQIAFEKMCSKRGAQELPERLSRRWVPGECARCGHAKRGGSPVGEAGVVVGRKAARDWFSKRRWSVQESEVWEQLTASAEVLLLARLEPGERVEARFSGRWSMPSPAWTVDVTAIVGRTGKRLRPKGRPEVALPVQAEMGPSRELSKIYGGKVSQIWAAEPEASVLEYAQTGRRHRKTQAELGMPPKMTLTRFRVRQTPEDGVVRLEKGPGVRGLPRGPSGDSVAVEKAKIAKASDYETGFVELRGVKTECRGAGSAVVWRRAESRVLDGMEVADVPVEKSTMPPNVQIIGARGPRQRKENEGLEVESRRKVEERKEKREGAAQKGCAVGAMGRPGVGAAVVWLLVFGRRRGRKEE